ncbi:MAG: hypothetical protein ACXVPQ_02720 [Bacteroidia bacterium]
MRGFIFLNLVLAFCGCSHSHFYDKQVALLDSTKIVLQVKLNELKKVETNIQQRGYSKYELYKRFLNSSLKDTISRHEATTIQQFLNAGEIIKQYSDGKNELIRQTETSIVQLQKLAADLRENNIHQRQALQFFETEKTHADKLVQVIEKNITAANIALMNYKSSTPRTEELIRQINHNQLPSVVADSTAE